MNLYLIIAIVLLLGVFMKSIIVTKQGIKISADNQLPKLLNDKIRIKVEYSGVGFADVMAVKHKYILAPKDPFSPGYEFYGEVVAAGLNVKTDLIGFKVAGMLPQMDAYQEYIDIDPDWAVKVPEGLDGEMAALLPLNYLTALALIEKSAKLIKGQTLFVHGAAGGVGTAVLELAALKGIKAYGTASTTKHGIVKNLGGIPFDYKNKNWIDQFFQLNPNGVDAVFDAMGSESFKRSWKLLTKKGSLVAYGFYKNSNSGTGAMIKGLLTLLLKQINFTRKKIAICGTPAIIKKDRSWYKKSLDQLLTWSVEGKLQPQLYKVFPWNEMEKAHEELIQRKVIGKILLQFT